MSLNQEQERAAKRLGRPRAGDGGGGFRQDEDAHGAVRKRRGPGSAGGVGCRRPGKRGGDHLHREGRGRDRRAREGGDRKIRDCDSGGPRRSVDIDDSRILQPDSAPQSVRGRDRPALLGGRHARSRAPEGEGVRRRAQAARQRRRPRSRSARCLPGRRGVRGHARDGAATRGGRSGRRVDRP